MKKMYDEETFDGILWDDVMSDFFPEARNEDEIAEELEDIWND